MSEQAFLAIDLGAESGRGVVGRFNGDRVSLEEIGRFPTGARAVTHSDGTLRWDIDNIFAEVDAVVERVLGQAGGSLSGVAVDSWGVDFGLIDKAGRLLAPPVCYRDSSHAEAREEMFQKFTPEEIWDASGIQSMSFNTLYQLSAAAKRDPAQLDAAARLLLIPDLIAHRLTGGTHVSVEATNATTTQMMLPGGSAWNLELMERAGLPTHFLGPVVMSPARIGTLASGNVPVYAPPTHDTASSVVAVPASTDRSWAFLSSGTWSLLGRELAVPVLSREAMRAGFSNEGGANGWIQFLKNIMGLWLVQECRKRLESTSGRAYPYETLAVLASEAAHGSLIDATHDRFLNPPDMVAAIKQACEESDQIEPVTEGEIIRCCLESLALAYRRACRQIEFLLGSKLDALHVLGGGSQNTLLNQWTADACGIPVYAGPKEATALGNILSQMIGAGLISGWAEAREISRNSFAVQEFVPNATEHARWAEREEKVIDL